MRMRKTSSADLEKQRLFEEEADQDYTRHLERQIKERDAIIRVMAVGAVAMEAEIERLRKFDEEVPF